jgi:GNAT superfamily N-acetyltransferase
MDPVSELPPGWATDLAVLQLTGSTVDDRGDHLVVRTADNPGFHWGNFVLVTDPAAGDDAERWVRTFAAEHPSATWIAVGLVAPPTDPSAWHALQVQLDVDEALTTRTRPAATDLADGYAVRQLDTSDWTQSVERAVAGNEREDPAAFRHFAEQRVAARRVLSARGDAAFFGAFAGDELLAELGIVRCGRTARYQDVGTDAAHRRRGLARHLLGLAAGWAEKRACDRWVIVAAADSDAGRLYRRAGFVPDRPSVLAYRRTDSPSSVRLRRTAGASD